MPTYTDKKTGRKVSFSILEALFAPDLTAGRKKKRSPEAKKKGSSSKLAPAMENTVAEGTPEVTPEVTPDITPEIAPETTVEDTDAPAENVEAPTANTDATTPGAADGAFTDGIVHTWEPPSNFQPASVGDEVAESVAEPEKPTTAEVETKSTQTDSVETKEASSAETRKNAGGEEPVLSDQSGDETEKEDKNSKKSKKSKMERSKWVTKEGVVLTLLGEAYLYRLLEHYEGLKYTLIAGRFEKMTGKKIDPMVVRKAMKKHLVKVPRRSTGTKE